MRPAPRLGSIAPVSEAHTFHVGIDENGLGPQLGPLVVTGVLARVTDSGAAHLARGALEALSVTGDSKKLASFQKPEVAEAWARALSPDAASPGDLLGHISLSPRDELEAPCPAASRPQCWGDAAPFSSSASLVARARGDLAALAEAGITVVAARSVIVCPELLHRDAQKGLSIFDVDLGAMERLLIAFREQAQRDIVATCGKVGGFGKYLPKLKALSGYPATIVTETRPEATYRIAGLGRVSFVQDADGAHALVAIASLVGKHVREDLMGRVARFYTARDPSLPRASGYRDPVTNRFVLATQEARKALGIADRCFRRP